MCYGIVPIREGLYEYYINVVIKLPSRLVFPVLNNKIPLNIFLQFPFLNFLIIFITY